MKLVIGKPDESEVVLAEESGGVWKPNPNLTAEMAMLQQGAHARAFVMWGEGDE